MLIICSFSLYMPLDVRWNIQTHGFLIPLYCFLQFSLFMMKVWSFLTNTMRQTSGSILSRPASCCSLTHSVQMRSVESTAQSQPDFMVPVVTLEPVVLPCWQCQYLIWHSFFWGWQLMHRVILKGAILAHQF